MVNKNDMNGRQAKKIRQQYSRDFREEAKRMAVEMVKEKTKEMDENIEKFKSKIFKPRPKWIPRAMWRFMVGRVANITEVSLNGLTDV